MAEALYPSQVELVGARAQGRAQLIEIKTSLQEPELAALIGQLASSLALFRVADTAESPAPLHPIVVDDALVYGTELVTTQRYRGKTNERLTRMMLNMALATAGIAPWEAVGVVLDPMCGRGTTLHWALAYGLDAVGFEPERSSLDHHANFLTTWAKRQRLPHEAISHKEKNKEQRHTSLTVAPNRDVLKAGHGQLVSTFCVDGGDPAIPLKGRTIDVVVADLPYGVQHAPKVKGPGKKAGKAIKGNKASPKQPDIPQTPELLARLVPAWAHWLRPGGAICLAWNLKRARRTKVEEILQLNGFRIVEMAEEASMAHRVDSTIIRDVIVAELLPENLRD